MRYLARFVFLHRAHERRTPTGVAAADEQVSHLRAATAWWGDDHDFAIRMDELRASLDFNERWSTFATDKRRGTTRMVHPDLGQLRLNYEVFLLAEDIDEQRLITWLPANDATAAGLASTSDTAAPTSPAQLRVID